MYSKLKLAAVITTSIAIQGCNDSNSSSEEQFLEKVNYEFSQTQGEWEYGFADYPVGGEIEWELTAEENKEFSLLDGTTGAGFYLHSHNRSDDTQMYITREINNLMPNAHYDVTLSLSIATNVNTQCQGIGGAPHAVTVKAGMTRKAIEKSVDHIDHYRIDADFGQQTQSGLDGEALGHIGNDVLEDCDPGSDVFAIKNLSNDVSKFEFTTNSEGSGWLTIMTDSGFEGPTSIYITKLEATFDVSEKSADGFSVALDFSEAQPKTQALFFDYPLGREWEWELTATPLTTVSLDDNSEATGYFLHSYNRSDDTGMLLYTPVKGLAPNTNYTADVSLTIATNVNDMCFGIGGAPHSVAVKTALSTNKPESIVPEDDNHYRINLDIGNNMSDGTQGFSLGHIGLSTLLDCDPSSQIYGLKSFDSQEIGQSLMVTTDESGIAYFSVLTDSGFEGPTSILFTQANISFVRDN